MLFPAVVTALLGALSVVSAAEEDEVVFIHTPLMDKDAYDSGEVHMTLMRLMENFVAELTSTFTSTSSLDPIPPAWLPHLLPSVSEYVPCVDGHVTYSSNHTYACKNADLYAFVPHSALGSTMLIGNDIWGWTDARSGREFGLVAQMDGTAFVEIMPEDGSVVYLGRLPTQSVDSIWRDIKVVEDHAYIGSEALGHGVQVFDLTKLLDSSLQKTPKNFNISSDLTAHFDGLPIGTSHNIVSHSTKPLIVAVGSMPRNDSCAAGLIFVDVSDPSSPKGVGCASQDGYVHDAQCLTYHGPHAAFEGVDVCYSFNEDTFTVYNISDPSSPIVVSTTPYYGVAYSHQGWVIDESDQRYLLLDDELDEVFQRGWASDNTTVTYIWDIQDLEHPKLTGHYNSPAKAIDHNLYVVDGLAYEANYKAGLRVLDVSGVVNDPTGASIEEVAYFDVHPEDDAVGGVVEFGGAWSSYPYFASGFILVNSMERGLFVVKLNGVTV